MIDTDEVDSMPDEDQPTGDETPPAVVRDGNRASVDTPADSPYTNRLRHFGAHWDPASARWWVGIAKVDGLKQLLTLPRGSPIDEPQPPPEETRSVATQLVELALAQYTLGVTDTDDAFGVHADRPHIAMMLRGGKIGLRRELARGYFAEHQTAVAQQALADAVATLEGFAAQADPQCVNLRVAQAGAGVVYIDMADAEGHVIEISGGTWKICTDAPGVLFRRTKLTAEMAKPVVGGDIAKLWDFIPVSEADRPLLLAWLVHALIQPDVSHTILLLKAEQGSAKSTITKWLVSLVDPLSAPLRKAPRDAEGWITAANASWVVALENISGVIPLWLSDCLCRASTGDGDVRRALYTDADVSVFAFRRVVIINGIDVTVTQGDLADRLLRVALPRIGEDDRKKEQEVEANWQQARPAIFGALLDLAAEVHHRIRSITVDKLPRMADYATVLAAVDQVMETKGLVYYREQCRRIAADTLDTPFIDQIVSRRYGCIDKTASQILTDIERRMRNDDDGWRPPKGWPARAQEVTNQLTRHAQAMRAQGWIVEDDGGHNHRNALQWTLNPPPKGRRVAKPTRAPRTTRKTTKTPIQTM
ncbi:MAG: ATP-binding protein [Mycobacterium sp.]